MEEIPEIIGNPDLTIGQKGLVDSFDDDVVIYDFKGM
jgi:hypothetical protein